MERKAKCGDDFGASNSQHAWALTDVFTGELPD
jgi:hypothetical protein